jgi:hypothetical protein
VNLSDEFEGLMDEVRLSSSARSAAWIGAVYLNQENPTNTIVLGSQQDRDTIPEGVTELFTNQIFAGQLRTEVPTQSLSNGWNLIAWPYMTARNNNDTNAIGWQFLTSLGACGATNQVQAEAEGDWITVIEGGLFRRFWLMDNMADTNYNDRWWDPRGLVGGKPRGNFADFNMRAGDGFWYQHQSNGVSWTPTLE